MTGYAGGSVAHSAALCIARQSIDARRCRVPLPLGALQKPQNPQAVVPPTPLFSDESGRQDPVKIRVLLM